MVNGGQESMRIYAPETDAKGVRDGVIQVTVDPNIGHSVVEALTQPVAQVPEMRVVAVHVALGQFTGNTQAHDFQDVLRARPLTQFLATAMQQRLQGQARPDEQGSNPFGSINLVPGD